MRVDLPFAYVQEDFSGGPVKRTRVVGDLLAVDLREIDVADAPVVLRHPGLHSRHFSEHGPSAPIERRFVEASELPFMVEFRLHEDVLYEPLVCKVSRPVGRSRWRDFYDRTPISDPQLLPRFLADESLKRRLHSDFYRKKVWDAPLEGPYLRSSRARDERAVTEELAAFVAIGGEFYRRTTEPVWVLGAAQRFPTFGPAVHYPHCCWRIDEADQFVAAVAARGGDADETAQVVGRFAEIVDPDLYGRLTEIFCRAELRALTDAVVAHMGVDLHLAPAHRARAFVDLRKASRDPQAPESSVPLEAALALLRGSARHDDREMAQRSSAVLDACAARLDRHPHRAADAGRWAGP